MRRNSFFARLVGFSSTPFLWAACFNWATAQDVDFARDVQPIFAKHCVACHGPGEAESGLQITDQASVFGELDSGEVAVVSGKPDESELLNRIKSDDEDMRMPPEGKPLSAEQIDKLGKLAGPRLLEVGCGIGTYTQHFAKQGLAVTAVDIDLAHHAENFLMDLFHSFPNVGIFNYI